MIKKADYFIEKLNLKTHPEGGFYAETYRCQQTLNNDEGKARNISTAIYFLLKDQQKSHLHRIKSDELWFHHQGETLAITLIVDDKIEVIYLGTNLAAGEVLQATIPANCWFASQVKNQNGFALVSCTVAPGFDFEDFEMAKKEDLISQYPHYKAFFEDLCLS